jgi:uroporphyrinogen decarboxylase
MNARDNFQRMMNHNSPRWLPLMLPMTTPVADELQQRKGTRNPADAYGLDFDHTSASPRYNPEGWLEAYRRLGIAIPSHHRIDTFGELWEVPPRETLGKATHLCRMLHPLSTLESLSQVESLPWPNMVDPSIAAKVRDAVTAGRQRGRAVVGWQACSVFEHAWYLRGMDELFMDLIEGREIGTWLLDYFMERSILAGRTMAQAGVDVIALGDDIGMQQQMLMDPNFWREHLKPRLARIIDAVVHADPQHRPWIYYHSDGNVMPVVDDLIEIGVDILNPVQPECMPLDEVFSRWSAKLKFWGMIGTQTTMPFGSVADVRQAVAHLADWAKRGVAIVVAPTHVLEPDVPWENIEALVQAVKAVQLGTPVAA